jgi:dihydrolipoamide dehydrogenase
MTETETNVYDVVVLGAGPVGENVADRTRAAGLTTAVVESELVGGECSYWACMPSKALLRPVIARADARRVPGLRQAVQGPLDAAAVLAHRNYYTSDWTDDGAAQWLDGIGADLYRGQGRLTGPRTVTVGDKVLTARHAVAVATGTRAVLPDLPGLAEVKPWTSREATSAQTVPGRLVVVGGGVVATEMATLYQALGTQVTVLVRGKGLLNRMEPFAGELVAEALTEAGADVRTGASVESVTRTADGVVVVVTGAGDRIEADEILFATGRAPHTDDLGLETLGLEPGSWLTVDDSLLVTGTDWLYAVGDVNHRALLTHQGKYQARIAGAAIAARASGVPILESDPWGAHAATADHDAVPQVVFTDPEVASVGLTLAEAEQAGHRVRAVDVPIAVAGSSLYGDGYKGRARMVVDLEDEIVRGVTFVGPGVGEMIHSATIAVAGRVPISRLWHAVPSYPTISEVWLRLLETYRDN